MLWVDKYRPLALNKLDFHDGLTDRLQGTRPPIFCRSSCDH